MEYNIIPYNPYASLESYKLMMQEYNTYETTKGNFQREDLVIIEVCRIDENKTIWTDSKTEYEV